MITATEVGICIAIIILLVGAVFWAALKAGASIGDDRDDI